MKSLNPNEHILDNIEYTLYSAGPGKRQANFLIDNGIIYLFARLVLAKPVVILASVIYDWTGSMVAFYICYYCCYFCWSVTYRTGLESLNRGKTIGKMITGTRAVYEDGTRLRVGGALMRSVVRLIPLEFLSGLGAECYPLHDRWTKTNVIDEKYSILPIQK